MVFVQICVGSSCYLKGSEEIVKRMQELIKQHNLEDEIILSGSFCANQCNRTGVTIHVDDDVFTGIVPASLDQFFEENILTRI